MLGRTAGVSTAAPIDASAVLETGEQARRRDALLVQSCRSGEESAWAAIVERFSPYVYAIALRFGLRDDRAQDVHQEVFMRVFTHLDSLHDERALRPWIAQLTRHVAIDRLRVEARESPEVDLERLPAEDPALERLELSITVRRALDELPAPFGEALRRFFIDDQSYRTIGAALEVAPGTVASRISRGLVMLGEVLDRAPSPAGPTPTAHDG